MFFGNQNFGFTLGRDLNLIERKQETLSDTFSVKEILIAKEANKLKYIFQS
jgi:hypothetical protein